MSPHMGMLLLCIPAFGALALAMERHQKDLFGAALPLARTRLWRAAGWLLLLAALVLAVQCWGWAIGLVVYSGHTSASAGLVFLALLRAERRKQAAPHRVQPKA